MYDYPYREAFYLDNTEKYLSITFKLEEGDPGYSSEDPDANTVILTNDDIIENTFELNEGITDAQSLNFQNCMSSYIKFATTYVTVALYGKQIDVQMVVDTDTENPIPLGKFYVETNNKSFDGKTQEIVAYDKLFDIINCDTLIIKYIYDSFSFPITVKDFRDNFFSEFEIEQENVELINDDILLPKQLGEEEYPAGSDIVRFIAEINGVFPHMGKDGLLHWISLDMGDIDTVPLFPSSYTFPGTDTFPNEGYLGTYIDIYKDQYQEGSVIWSNFLTLAPDGIEIRNETNDVAYYLQEYGVNNPYTIINNFLCYGLTEGQYQQIASRLFRKIRLIRYFPVEMVKMADPCLEPGDRIFIRTERDTSIQTYIFNKTTTGIRVAFEDVQTQGTYLLGQYDRNQSSNAMLKNLDNRVGNIEKSGSGPLQIQSVAALPDNPQLNVLYLIQGTVQVD